MGEDRMSAVREKDQADFDLETFVDLFDTAISSDNPAVQRALKNLLMIAAIVNSEDADAGMRHGPLRRVLEDQKHILRRLEQVENSTNQIYRQPNTYGPMPVPMPATPWQGPTIGPLVPNPNGPSVGTPIGLPPGTIWTTSGTSTSYTLGAKSSTAVDDQLAPEPILPESKYQTLLDKFQ